MLKPHALIMSGYGINCEEETKYAFELAGAEATIVHINDLIEGTESLNTYQILAFPGGFSYGDHIGSGNAFANKMRNHLWEEVCTFIEKDTLTLGICNGFQILTNLGIFSLNKSTKGERNIALLPNSSARYVVRWVDLEVSGKSPFYMNIDTLSLPIAHGEGRFFTNDRVLQQLQEQQLLAARYIQGEICDYQSLPANPNGSLSNIAAITDTTGRILGMMPHPERAIFFTQLPHWTWRKEEYKRRKEAVPFFGPGLQIFQNAVNYFS